MRRSDCAFPCGRCLCNHCANNVETIDNCTGEAKEPCFVCDECRWYDRDTRHKTTMTRLFNGLIPHYHEGTYTGSVYLDGKDTRDLSLFDISLKVGSVFQNPRSQFFNVDTTSELAFGPENHGIAEDLVRDRVKRVAAQLKLEPLLDRSIFSLSGGEKQRVAVASAIASGRPLILFDEPTSGLDLFHMRQVANVVNQVANAGRTALVVTHDPEFILRCCNYVLHLENGQILESYSIENGDGRNRLLKFFLNDMEKEVSTE